MQIYLSLTNRKHMAFFHMVYRSSSDPDGKTKGHKVLHKMSPLMFETALIKRVQHHPRLIIRIVCKSSFRYC